MKTIAKVLSVVLAMVLLVCAFAFVISAEDAVVDSGTVYNETANKTYTGENCITNAFYQVSHATYNPNYYNVHNTIKLMSDVTVTGDYMFVRRNVTLDLNGYTLTLTGDTESGRGTFYCDTNNTTFTVTGEGKIITSGNRPFFSEAVNEANGLYTFNVIGTGKGIDIEFDATKNGRFVGMNGGNVNFENVDIVYKGWNSTYTTFEISGNYNPTVTFTNSTIEALENCSKIGTNNYTNSVTQGDKAFFNLNGQAQVKFVNSSVRASNNGAIFSLNGGTVGNSETGVVVDAKDSYFDAAGHYNAGTTIFGAWKQAYSGVYNFDGCEIVYAQRFDATNWNNTTTPPTYNIHNTRITKIAGWFDQSKDFSSYDSSYTGRTYNFTGNSALITDFKVTSGTTYGGNIGIGAWVKLGEGTRVASPEGVASATLAEGCQLYFDPAGDPTAPWIVAKEAPATADAATDVYFANMSYNYWGESSFGTGSNFTHRTANSNGSTVTVEGTAPAANPYADGESSIKHGTVHTVKVGGNTAYKYTVIAPDNDPDATIFPSGKDTDAYTITGKVFNLTTYKQVVIDADIMANENGFANLIIAFQVRGQSGAPRAGGTDAGIKVSNNGTVEYTGSAGNKISQAENMPKLSVTDWNHITIVCDVVENTATYYINGQVAIVGKLINAHDGYMAGTESGLYCQGFRISTTTQGHKVGSGYLLDNVMQRGYANSGAAYTQLTTASDIVANENIRVNGKPYQTLGAALEAAAAIEDSVDLYGNIATAQTVTTNGKVNLNGYTFDYTADSYPVVRAADSYTFNSEITDTLEVVTYLDYYTYESVTDTVKLGHKIPTYVGKNYETAVATATFAGWQEYAGQYVDSTLIDKGSVEVYGNYDVQVKSAKALGIKTNLSLYSNFVVNVFVPKTLVDEGYVTLNYENIDTYTIGEVEYYVVSEGTNYEGVASNVTFDITVTDVSEEPVFDADGYANITANNYVNVSVLKYAETILANEKYADDHELMRAMLNYVFEAAIYFGDAYLASALVNYDVEEAGTTYNPVVENEYGIATNVYVDLNENAPAIVLELAEAYTGTVTVTYTNVYGTEKTITIEAENATEIVIDQLRVYNLDATVTVTFAGVEGEVVYNLDAYANSLEGNEAETLIKALYDYVAVAKAYKL